MALREMRIIRLGLVEARNQSSAGHTAHLGDGLPLFLRGWNEYAARFRSLGLSEMSVYGRVNG